MKRAASEEAEMPAAKKMRSDSIEDGQSNNKDQQTEATLALPSRPDGDGQSTAKSSTVGKQRKRDVIGTQQGEAGSSGKQTHESQSTSEATSNSGGPGNRKVERTNDTDGVAEQEAEHIKDPTSSDELLDLLVLAAECQREIDAYETDLGALALQGAEKEELQSATALEDGSGPQHKIDFLHERQMPRLRRLTELGTVPGMNKQPALEPLTATWFAKARALADAQQSTLNARTALLQQQKQADRTYALIEHLILRKARVMAKADDDDNLPAEAQQLDQDIDRVRSEFGRLGERHGQLLQQINGLAKEESSLAEKLLLETDMVLVETGLLSPEKPGMASVAQRPPEIRRTTGSNSEIGRISSSAQTNREGGRRDYDAAAGNEMDAVRQPPRSPPPSLADIVRGNKMRDYGRAERAISEADLHFNQVRQTYPERLLDFFRRRDRGEIGGTKTDFDAEYFMDRSQANRTLAQAEAEFEYQKKLARATGALSLRLHTSNFSDQPDDGYNSSELDGEDPMLDRERLEAWLDEEILNKRRDESHWQTDIKESISDAPEWFDSRSQRRYATGKQRKHIEQWQAQQEWLRGQVVPPTREEQDAIDAVRIFEALPADITDRVSPPERPTYGDLIALCDKD